MPLSIVIPAFNEEKYIKNTIDTCISLLERVIELEIIVVDNASTDATSTILRNYSQIKLITLDKKVTISRARNIGWNQATNALVAFMDADMIITPEWTKTIKALELSITESPQQITGCKCYPSQSPSWIEKIWFNNENYRHKTEKYINSGNLITSKDLLIKINGFDEGLITGEDVDICSRALKNGAQLIINKEFKIYHDGYPKTIKAFFKREQWHGVGDLKSLSTFFKSKVALCSYLINFLLVVSLIIFLLGSCLFYLPLTCSILLIIVTAHLKFQVKSLMMLPQIYFLQFLYFGGRFASILIRNKV